MRIFKCLAIAYCLLFPYLVYAQCNNANTDTWSRQCYFNNTCTGEQGNPCQANDVNLTSISLLDVNGDPLSTCDPGETIDVYIWGSFDANAERYAVRINADINVNGSFDSEINDCAFETILVGQTTILLAGPISVLCNDEITLADTWVAWESSAAVCSGTTLCGQYPPSKCRKNNIDVLSVINPNFSTECSAPTNSVQFIDGTSGGNSPYTYVWDFGDGTTSTLQNPLHVIPGQGTYTIKIAVTDSDGITAERTLTSDFVECAFLPIQLVRFSASQLEDHVQLKWTTASELNNSHFLIERSLNGILFNSVGEVTGHGNSFEVQEYAFIDRTVLKSKLYYRLKQVDLDRKYSYSPIRAVSLNQENKIDNIVYFPNPAKNQISISSSNQYDHIKLEIFDLTGSLIQSSQINSDDIISLIDLPQSIYYFRLTDENQKVIDMQKIAILH